MGVEISAYLGPYVAYSVSVSVVTRQQDACREPAACPSPTDGYCSRCGVQVSKRFKEAQVEIEDPDPEEIVDELGETFTWPKSLGKDIAGKRTYVIRPNEQRAGCASRRDEWDAKRGEETVAPVTAELVRAETEWLAHAFAEEIEEIRNRCGPENVKVEWGLLIYCW